MRLNNENNGLARKPVRVLLGHPLQPLSLSQCVVLCPFTLRIFHRGGLAMQYSEIHRRMTIVDW